MERRSFLGALTGFVTLSIPVKTWANDPPVNGLKQSNLSLQWDGDTLLNPPLSVSTWEMNFEEDDNVLFFFRLSNRGTARVRMVHIQPHGGVLASPAGIPVLSGWRIVERFDPIGAGGTKNFYKRNRGNGQITNDGWRADNDSNAFFLQTERSAGNWETVPVPSGRDGWMDVRQTVAHMEWHNPEIHFEVRSVDRRH